MSLGIKIECLHEPELLFGGNAQGVEPRRILAKSGPADAASGKQIRVGLVGPAEDVQQARLWLPKLNRFAVAHDKNARRFKDWPGAMRAFGVTFEVEDRFVRVLDEEHLRLATNKGSPVDRFRRIARFVRREDLNLFRRCATGLHHCLFTR